MKSLCVKWYQTHLFSSLPIPCLPESSAACCSSVPKPNDLKAPENPRKPLTCLSHRLKWWIHLASVDAAGEPVNACRVAALFTTTAVIDAAVNNAVAVTLASEQVVARCVTDFC